MRSRAGAWHIDPARVGVIGFSAGGHLSVLAGTQIAEANPAAADPVDRVSARPAFLGLIYASISDDIVFKADTPPSFFLFGDNDGVVKGRGDRYRQLRVLGVPAEIHVLSGVTHGFGIRATNPPHVAIWPQLFVNWLEASAFLKTS